MQIYLDDRLSLAPGLVLDDDGLIDPFLGAVHELNASARWAVANLQKPIEFGKLAERFSTEFGIALKRASSDLHNLIDGLNRHALVRVESSVGSRLRRARSWPIRYASGLVGLSSDVVLSRHPATARGVTAACARLMAPFALLWAIFGLVLFALLGEVHPEASAMWKLDVVGYLVVLVLLLAASMVAHEVGHIIGLSKSARHSSIVLRRFLSISVARSAPTRNPRFMAALGPVSAFAVTSMFAPLSLLPFQAAAAFGVAPLVGIAHLVHVFPFAADGKMIWRRNAGGNNELGH